MIFKKEVDRLGPAFRCNKLCTGALEDWVSVITRAVL